MLPSAGGALPLVVTFNTGLVVLAVLQLILALGLANLVLRPDSPPLVLASAAQAAAPWLCLRDLPLIGQVPAHVVPPWAQDTQVQCPPILTLIYMYIRIHNIINRHSQTEIGFGHLAAKILIDGWFLRIFSE